MTTLACRCGKRYRLPDDAPDRPRRCPACRRNLLPATSADQPAVLHSAEGRPTQGKRSLEQRLDEWLARGWRRYLRLFAIEWRSPEAGLRRCLRGAHHSFGLPSTCTMCGARTVGTDVAAVLNGDDARLQEAVAVYRHTVKGVRASTVLTLGLGLLLAIILLFSSIRNLAYVLIVIGAVAAVHVMLLLWFRRRFATVLSKLGGSPQGTRGAEFEPTCRDVIGPFLDRARTVEAMAAAHGEPSVHVALVARRRLGLEPERIPIDPQEVGLLQELLLRRGVSLPTESAHIDLFLNSCALLLDFEAFSARIAHAEAQGLSRDEAYVMLTSDDDYDLPFFIECERQAGRPCSELELRARMEAARSRLRVESFERDLHQRKMFEGVSVSAEIVDGLSPGAFEELIAMIFESRGCRAEKTGRAGDQGADVVIEAPGVRTVIQAKLYAEPVGNKAVQEAVAAKAHYGCHRACVVTNNLFSSAARELAATNDVELIDRRKLCELLAEFNRAPKDYARLARLLVPVERTEEPDLEEDMDDVDGSREGFPRV